MPDDDFVPRPVRPMRPAVPVQQKLGPTQTEILKKPPQPNQDITKGFITDPPTGVPPQPERLVTAHDTAARSARSKAGWAKRKAREEGLHPFPDKQAVGELTVKEAIQLALLIDKYPVLRKVLR